MFSPAVFVLTSSRFRKINYSAALLLTIALFHLEVAAQANPQSAAEPCAKFGEAFKGSNDLVAIQSYREALSRLG